MGNSLNKEKKLLVVTGGGDCPGLNAVIRAIVKSAHRSGNWKVFGSIEAFNGIIQEEGKIIELNIENTRGIHVKGGTIIKTTNKGNPMAYPSINELGELKYTDITDTLIQKIRNAGFDAVINIGGDGSQLISKTLFDKGLNIIGVPKTIDNDLSSTDVTFGFRTAVQIATDAFDKLVSTAESHNRAMVLEVMGRNAGWIALHTAIAGGAEICLIPEIAFDIDVVVREINKRYDKGKGFVNIVIAEGAKIDKSTVGRTERGDLNIKLGGVGNMLRHQLESHKCQADIRVTTLGHVQRGGTPIAFDRILATAFGVKAFDLAEKSLFGNMVCYTNNEVSFTSLEKAVSQYNFISPNHYLLHVARSIGISFGDK